MCKCLQTYKYLILLCTITILSPAYASSLRHDRTLSDLTLKDPTRPPGKSAIRNSRATNKARPYWTLNSILISPTRRLATINGKILQLGEHIHGAKLVAINASEVWLKNKQKQFRIKLLANDVKKISIMADN